MAARILEDDVLRRRTIIMNEHDGRPGIRTDHLVKEDLKLQMERKVEKRRIKKWKNLFTFSKTPTVTFTGQELWDELFYQLKNYSKILKPSKDVHGKTKEFYGGKQGYGFDDLAMAIQINLECKRRFYKPNSKYKNYILKRQSNG